MKSNVLAIVLVAVLCNACFMRSKQDDSLRALVILNESLEESAEASFNKSESLYTEINFLKNEQEEKYGDLYDDVMKINRMSNELCGDIERLKQEIIARAEHLDYDQDVRIELRDVRHKNNKYAASELLIGDGGPMKGDSLEAWIGDYQYFMLHFVDPLDVAYLNIKDQLNTNVVIEGEVYSFWIEDYCVHVPLAGTIAMLTKLQSDIRYTEAEVLSYLMYNQDDLIRATE